MEGPGLALAALILAMAVSRSTGQCCPNGLRMLALLCPAVVGLHPSWLDLGTQGCVCCCKDSDWAPWICVQATPWTQPMDSSVVLLQSALAGRGVPGLTIPLLAWESGLILHKQPYQRLSVLSAQHLPNPRC